MPVSITKPTVAVTLGYTYATQVNTCLDTLAAATHVGGVNGAQWTSASLAIDNNVAWGGYSITALKAASYTQQTTVTTSNSVWTKTDGNLYFTNGSGTQIQITSGGTLFSGAMAGLWNSTSVTNSPTIATGDAFIDYRVDTSAARVITLPSAAAVGAGRFYVFHDVTGGGSVNNITLTPAGADTIDGSASLVLNTAYAWAFLVSTGSGWAALIPRFGGDLGGVNGNQTVLAATGLAGSFPIKCATMAFASTVAVPVFKQSASASAAGVYMYIEAQTAGGTNQAGGPLNLAGGNATGTGEGGKVVICSQVSGYQPTFVAAAFSVSRRIAAIHADPVTANVPTGDKVIYIANAAVLPSSNPTGGGVLYVNAGALTYRGSTGTVTILGPA